MDLLQLFATSYKVSKFSKYWHFVKGEPLVIPDVTTISHKILAVGRGIECLYNRWNKKGLPVCYLVAKSCLTLWDPMDCGLPGSSVHGISQVRILKWVVMSFSRGFSQPRDQTHISCITDTFFTTEPPGKPQLSLESAPVSHSPPALVSPSSHDLASRLLQQHPNGRKSNSHPAHAPASSLHCRRRDFFKKAMLRWHLPT